MFSPTIFIDKFLDFLKSKINIRFLENNETVLVQVGLFCLTYIIPVLSIFAGTFIGLRYGLGVKAVLSGWVLALICIFLRYVADKMLPYTKSVLQKSPSQISSRSVLDIFTVSVGLAGVIYLIFSIYNIFTARTVAVGFDSFLSGLIVFFVSEYIMAMLLNPKESLNINLEKETSAAGELIGVCSLVIKAMYRMVPVIFGFSMIAAVLMILLLMLSRNLTPASLFDLGEMLSMALLPFVAYVLFLVYYFVLDLCMAFLRIPEKLDALNKKK